MPSDVDMSAADAVMLALDILEHFKESSLYEDWQGNVDSEDISDLREFDKMLNKLRKLQEFLLT